MDKKGKHRDIVSIIEKYEKVRKAGKTFVYTVLYARVNKKMMLESAKLLGYTCEARALG